MAHVLVLVFQIHSSLILKRRREMHFPKHFRFWNLWRKQNRAFIEVSTRTCYADGLVLIVFLFLKLTRSHSRLIIKSVRNYTFTWLLFAFNRLIYRCCCHFPFHWIPRRLFYSMAEIQKNISLTLRPSQSVFPSNLQTHFSRDDNYDYFTEMTGPSAHLVSRACE